MNVSICTRICRIFLFFRLFHSLSHSTDEFSIFDAYVILCNVWHEKWADSTKTCAYMISIILFTRSLAIRVFMGIDSGKRASPIISKAGLMVQKRLIFQFKQRNQIISRRIYLTSDGNLSFDFLQIYENIKTSKFLGNALNLFASCALHSFCLQLFHNFKNIKIKSFSIHLFISF